MKIDAGYQRFFRDSFESARWSAEVDGTEPRMGVVKEAGKERLAKAEGGSGGRPPSASGMERGWYVG